MTFPLRRTTGAALSAAALIALAGGAPAEATSDDKLGGDLGGIRTAFAKAGLELGIDYTGEALGVVSGGVKRGVVYDGQLMVSLDADLDKMAGWSGATARASFLEVHGRSPSGTRVGDALFAVSNIEAQPGPRLFELWLEQSFAGDRLKIRAGQILADGEFAVSDTAGGLINGAFGWPAIAAADMTAGGPAYPLTAPGVLLRAKPAKDVTVMAAVYSGNPAGPGCAGDPQVCDPDGTNFRLGGGALWMGEVQYAAKLGDAGLPGTYKLGAWRETGAFPNQLTGANDEHGDLGGYAVIDQMVWRRAGADDQGLSVFLRGGVAPADRNLISWYVDGGVGFKGPFASRPDDRLTLGLAYANVSRDAADADRAAGPPTPERDYEAAIELSYMARLTLWWTLQPDLQYIVHPGGRILNPRTGVGTLPDTLVVGVRTALSF